jgi:NADH-quinone oxidoreductase subunit C
MNTLNQLITDLRSLPAEVNEVDYRKRGYHLEVELGSQQVRPFASLLRQRGFYLVFVSAVHVSPSIEVIYQFADFSRPCRILGRAAVTDDGAIPTISDIFDGANWHERETKDMFGIIFSGHPYLEPLLLPEENADLKPLLKREDAVKTRDNLRSPAGKPLPEEASPEPGQGGR